MTSIKLGVLNGFRAIAIFLVIYTHTLTVKVAQKLDIRWFDDMWIGVNLFFILSGFVLYLPFATGRKSFENKSDISTFYKNRFLRLYPLFIFILLIAFMFYGEMNLIRLKSLILTLFSISVFTNDEFLPTVLPVYWSLQIEILFSLVFPLLILGIKRYGVINLFIFCFILSFVTRLASYNINHLYLHLNPIKDSIVGRLDDFIVGMCLSHAYVNRKLLLSKYFKSPIWLFAGLLLIGLGLLIIFLIRTDQISRIYLAVINNFFQAGFSVWICHSLVASNFFTSFLSSKFMQLIGAMCFSIYSWHELFIGRISTGYLYDIPDFLAYLLLVFLTSSFTYRFIEFRKEENWKSLFFLKRF